MAKIFLILILGLSLFANYEIKDKEFIYEISSEYNEDGLVVGCKVVKINLNKEQIWEKSFVDSKKNYICSGGLIQDNYLYIYGGILERFKGYVKSPAWITKISIKDGQDKQANWYVSNDNNIQKIWFSENKLIAMIYSIKDNQPITSFFSINSNLNIKAIATYEGVYLENYDDIKLYKNILDFTVSGKKYTLNLGD